jgi:hypothetical protein
MTEPGHAASFGIDLIIMASAGGVGFAVGAAAVERDAGECAEAGIFTPWAPWRAGDAGAASSPRTQSVWAICAAFAARCSLVRCDQSAA